MGTCGCIFGTDGETWKPITKMTRSGLDLLVNTPSYVVATVPSPYVRIPQLVVVVGPSENEPINQWFSAHGISVTGSVSVLTLDHFSNNVMTEFAPEEFMSAFVWGYKNRVLSYQHNLLKIIP